LKYAPHRVSISLVWAPQLGVQYFLGSFQLVSQNSRRNGLAILLRKQQQPNPAEDDTAFLNPQLLALQPLKYIFNLGFE